MKIDKMRWYRIRPNGPCGESHIVRIDDTVMKYAVVDYYDGRLWFVGSLPKCKAWINGVLDARKDNNGKTIYMGAWQR